MVTHNANYMLYVISAYHKFILEHIILFVCYNISSKFLAIHPDYGVVWTDGKTIYLAPVQLSHSQVVNQRALKLGKFE